MDKPQFKPFILYTCEIILVCLVFCLMDASPSLADMGVQPILPGGSNIQPEDETPIQMASEKVVLNVRPTTEMDDFIVTRNPAEYGLSGSFDGSPGMYPAVADVLADFTMLNPTNEAVSMTAWFPLASILEAEEWNLNPGDVVPSIVRFQVITEGRPIEYNVSELPNPKGVDKPLLPWASFSVTFPPDVETHVQISYTVPAWWSYEGLAMNLYYILQTGAGWSGPIGKADLVVNLPYPASAETIWKMPEGGQIDGHQVRWTWENLEPGPLDDFFIQLLLLNRWDELQAARAAVTANPQDGEAWLNLASTYTMLTRGRAYSAARMLPGFGEIYQPMGVHAAQEALHLMPNDGRPHYELALLYASALLENATIKDLKPVMGELKIVEELEPALAPNIHDALDFLGVFWVVETARAEASSMPVPLATTEPTTKPIPTTKLVPSVSPLLRLTFTSQATPTSIQIPQGSHIMIILLIMAATALFTVVVYMLIKRK